MTEHVFDQDTYDLLKSKLLTALQRLHEAIAVADANPPGPTLEQFFLKHKHREIDFHLRVDEVEQGKLRFYIHPLNTDGDTWDFFVNGNQLTPIVPVDCPTGTCPTQP